MHSVNIPSSMTQMYLGLSLDDTNSALWIHRHNSVANWVWNVFVTNLRASLHLLWPITKLDINPLNAELTLRRLMSYIYMEHPFLMFLDHTQRRSTVGRTPLDE